MVSDRPTARPPALKLIIGEPVSQQTLKGWRHLRRRERLGNTTPGWSMAATGPLGRPNMFM